MKKTMLAIAAVIAVLGTAVTPATANSTVDTIAIIDTQFDGANVGTNVTHVCVTACSNNSAPKPGNKDQLGNYTHGIGIAEIARKSNPSAHLVLIRAGSTKVGPVSSQGLLDGLKWVEQNAARLGIDVVSISLSAGNAAKCMPVGAVKHQDVVNSINNIIANGTAVIAAAGNGNSSTASILNYPACIPNVIAVSIDIGVRQGATNANTDFIASADGNNFETSIGSINWGSSSALTIMVSSAWGSFVHVPNTKQKIRLNVLN